MSIRDRGPIDTDVKSSSELCETLQELGIESYDGLDYDSTLRINGVVVEVPFAYEHERAFYQCKQLTETKLFHVKFIRICTRPNLYVQNTAVHWQKKFEPTIDGPYTKIDDDGMLYVSCDFRDLVSFLKKVKL